MKIRKSFVTGGRTTNADKRASLTLSRRTVLGSLGVMMAAPALAVARPQVFSIPRKNSRKSQRPLRFAFGMFLQESNTFCPELSGLERFKYSDLAFGQEILPIAKQSNHFIGGISRAAEQLGVELYPTVIASASPYGIVEKKAYEYITGEIYERLRGAGKLDGIVFSFHGAMVSETTMDPEGEVIQTMRSIVGPGVPIACTFDLHCKVSQRMVDHADAFFYNNENPHVDSFDRGMEATQVCARIARGELDPVMVFKKPGVLVPTLKVRPPTAGPFVDIFKRAFEMEKDPRVINVNIGPGFPWCDVPDAGAHVVPVVHKDRQLAEDLAGELSERIWRARHEFIPTITPVEEGVSRAIAAKEGPVVLLDVSDNPGTGTTEDSNSVLRELYRQKAKNAAFAIIRQPDAVRKCLEAGPGADVRLDLGYPHRGVGEPIAMSARVKTISDGVYLHSSPTSDRDSVNLGRTAVIENEGVEILITERTSPVNSPEIFRRHGIDPAAKQILVIKTFKMYSEPYFKSLAREMIEVDANGQSSQNLQRYDWKHIPRPIFPVDDI